MQIANEVHFVILSNIYNQIRDEISSSLRDKIRNQVHADYEVDCKYPESIYFPVVNQIHHQIISQIYEQISSVFRVQTLGQIRGEEENNSRN